MEELKPCPFCGSHPFTEEVDTYKRPDSKWWVLCECGVIFTKTPHSSFDTKIEAISAWNTRAERTCEIMAGSGYDSLLNEDCWHMSCGHMATGSVKPNYCSECGAKVVE